MSAALKWKDCDQILSISPPFTFSQSWKVSLCFSILRSSVKIILYLFRCLFSAPLSKQDACHIIANLPGKEEGSTATLSSSSWCLSLATLDEMVSRVSVLL